MTEIRCKCGQRLADQDDVRYEIRIKSGKNIHVTFPEGTVTCPKCGEIYCLPRFEGNTTQEVKFE
jgi:hypothetical protein